MTRAIQILLMVVVIVVALAAFFKRPSQVAQGSAVVNTEAKAPHTESGTGTLRKAFSAGAEAPETAGARIIRMIQGESKEHRLTQVEVAEYLSKHKRSAFSLVAAFGVTQDREYLKEAGTNAPNDPFVQTAVLLHNVFPEDRQKWIEALKESSPENSLPHFLSARDLMTTGDLNGALGEIDRARGKSYDDRFKEMALAQEEAYLSAGRSPAEAKALGSAEVFLPQLAPFKKLGRDLAEAADQYGSSGDLQSQQTILSATWELGNQMRVEGRAGTLLHGLVGLALENIALNKWPEGTEAPFLEVSVAEQLAKNRESRANIREISPIVSRWLPTASENDVILYVDRLRMFGEWETMKWLRNQHPHLLE